MRHVLDCSVAVRWLVPQTHSAQAVRILEKLQAGHLVLIAPDVIVPELGHVLRKLVVGKKLGGERAGPFLERFLSLPIEMEPSRLLAADALRLALQHGATFYDALYLALAEREGVSVLTADDRMENAFARLGRTISLASFQ